MKLAANEKEVLLLELFPMVAKTFLTDMKVKAYAAAKPAEPKAEEKKAEEVKKVVITGNAVTAPLPGRIIELKVKVGDTVKAGGGHEDGECRDDRLCRHGEAGAGAARRERGDRRRTGRDRMIPIGTFVRRMGSWLYVGCPFSCGFIIKQYICTIK